MSCFSLIAKLIFLNSSVRLTSGIASASETKTKAVLLPLFHLCYSVGRK